MGIERTSVTMEVARLGFGKVESDGDACYIGREKPLSGRGPGTGVRPQCVAWGTRGINQQTAVHRSGAGFMKVTFWLNTTGDRFYEWLQRRTRSDSESGKLEFATEEGRIRLWPVVQHWHPDNVWDIWMSAHRIVRSGEDEERREELPRVIQFTVLTTARERIQVDAECRLSEVPAVMEYFEELLEGIGRAWPEAKEWLEALVAKPPKDRGRRLGGRPKLGHDELIYRLAKAQEGEEMRRDDPKLYWKEIAREIGWRYGADEKGLALLRDARHRLRALEKKDPDGLVREVAQRRQVQAKNERNIEET